MLNTDTEDYHILELCNQSARKVSSLKVRVEQEENESEASWSKELRKWKFSSIFLSNTMYSDIEFLSSSSPYFAILSFRDTFTSFKSDHLFMICFTSLLCLIVFLLPL